MQRVAAPSANFCAGSSTKAPPLTAPCQIGRTQARRAGGFAAVGGGLRPPPQTRPPGGLPCGPPGSCRVPSPDLCLPPGPCKSPLPAGPRFLGIPLQGAGIGPQAVPPFGRDPRRKAPGRRLRRRACGPPAPFPPHRCRRACGPPACPFLNPPPAPKPRPPTLPLGKPGACTFLHINSLTAPRFWLRPAVPDSPACSGGRRRPHRRNTPPAPPWPPGRHGRPRTPSQ